MARVVTLTIGRWQQCPSRFSTERQHRRQQLIVETFGRFTYLADDVLRRPDQQRVTDDLLWPAVPPARSGSQRQGRLPQPSVTTSTTTAPCYRVRGLLPQASRLDRLRVQVCMRILVRADRGLGWLVWVWPLMLVVSRVASGRSLRCQPGRWIRWWCLAQSKTGVPWVSRTVGS